MSDESLPVTVREARWASDSDALGALRSTVFVEEQGVPREVEWDGRDADAWHVIAEHDQDPVGCGRLLPGGRIGRLAVQKGWRDRGLGRQLLDRLLDIARQQGMAEVCLHAQVNALQFYERAGFEATGDEFNEAGIRHRSMHLALDYRDWDDRVIAAGYPQPFGQLAVAQARHCRRELAILSPTLDRRVFNNEDFSAAVRTLLRRGRHSRVRILVQDVRAIVEYGHGLLELARRLPSGIEMRKLAEHPAWNGSTLVLRDRNTLLAHPGGETNPGIYLPGERGQCDSALSRFEDLWRSGVQDAEFRSLSV